LIGKILAEKMDFLDRSAKKDPVTDSFGSFLASLSSDGHCISCGQSFHLFNKEIRCCVCAKQFCNTCVRKVTDKEILEVIDASPTTQSHSCEKCSHILDFQKEREVRRKFRALKDQYQLTDVYANSTQIKDQIKQLLPQYDYLATSITEIKISGSSERDDTSFGISYPQAKLKEKKLLALFKDYEESLKKIDTALNGKTETEKLLVSNVKKSFTNYLQVSLVSFQDIQKKVSKVELNSVVHVYIFLRQLEFETRSHATFPGRFKKILDEVSEHVIRESSQICTLQAQIDWESMKARIDKRIKKRQQALITTPQTALIPPKDNIKSHKDSIVNTAEPTLMRKVTLLVSDQHKRFLTRGIHAPMTAKVLSFVLHKLEKGYDDALKWE